jgi:hypothetical protein
MPLGTRINLETGNEIDFDMIYRQAIEPAVVMAGLLCRRIDSMTGAGVIHKTIISAVLGSDLMVSDVTLANPNVFYELGMRHATRRGGTILISESTQRTPFDLSIVPRLTYFLDQNGTMSMEESHRFRAALEDTLKELLVHAGETDSPVYDFFPQITVTLPESDFGEHRVRGGLSRWRSRLLEITRVEDRVERLRQLRQLIVEVLSSREIDTALYGDLVLALRDLSAWDDLIRLIETLPAHLSERPSFLQPFAMALNRRNAEGDSERAERILKSLVQQNSEDSESWGLLGRIYKDRFQKTANPEDLERAIASYRSGYAGNNEDFYPGVNLATLLDVKSDMESRAELAEILPNLRALLDEKLKSGRAGYWETATALELACLARDWGAVDRHLLETRLRAAGNWMLESTAQNLRLLADRTNSASDAAKIRSIVKQLLEGAK